METKLHAEGGIPTFS